jgi:hypothetical protein
VDYFGAQGAQRKVARRVQGRHATVVGTKCDREPECGETRPMFVLVCPRVDRCVRVSNLVLTVTSVVHELSQAAVAHGFRLRGRSVSPHPQ